MKMKKITTVFFDLGGVLLELRPDKTVNYLAECSGLSREVVEKSFPLEDYFQFERGNMDELRFFDIWRKALDNNELTDADFTKAWDNLIGRELATSTILTKIKPYYQVWLLSNTNDHHIRYQTPKYLFFDQVDGKIYSYLEGCRKPEPEIFNLALERAGATPQESLFIDDMQVNVDQARKMGITTIHFTTPEELEIELKLLGLAGLD